jgi:hypothetical protein
MRFAIRTKVGVVPTGPKGQKRPADVIDTLKATIEAEKEKLLAELPHAVEPQLSAI